MGLITALFIETGWFQNERFAQMVGPMSSTLLPLLIAYTGGEVVAGKRGGVIVAARDRYPSDTVKLNPELVKGIIVIEPDEEILTEYQEKKAVYRRERERLEGLRNKPDVTKDGKRISLCANVGNTEDIRNALAVNIDGVGLFCSELLYMENTDFITEKE